MSDDRQRRIEQRAHEIWQREGCPEGRADDHWRLATAEVEKEEASAAVSLASAAPPAAESAPEASEPAPEAGEQPAAKAAAKLSRPTKSGASRASGKTEPAKVDEPKKTVRKKK